MRARETVHWPPPVAERQSNMKLLAVAAAFLVCADLCNARANCGTHVIDTAQKTSLKGLLDVVPASPPPASLAAYRRAHAHRSPDVHIVFHVISDGASSASSEKTIGRTTAPSHAVDGDSMNFRTQMNVRKHLTCRGCIESTL